MEIIPLDLADDDVMRQAYELDSRSALFGRESMPQWSFNDFLGFLRSPDSGERQEAVVAMAADRLVAMLTSWYFLLDNLDKVWFTLHVDPVARRRGVGSALLQHFEDRARTDGRTLALTDSKLPFGESKSHGYSQFARRHGYDLANIEVVRHLPLPVEDERIQAWIEQSTPADAGYRFETLIDEIPDQYIDSLCVLLGQLAVDAPTGAVDYEEESVTPERLRESRAMTRAMGRTVYETIAVTDDGTVAAQSTLLAPVQGDARVMQWGTFVHRKHRGHRLGLAVKARNLRALQAANPGSRLVSTQNAETNDYMVSINQQMGFEPVEDSVEFVKRL